jgi:hypothetical protein
MNYSQAEIIFKDKLNTRICVVDLGDSRHIVKEFITKDASVKFSQGSVSKEIIKSFHFFDNVLQVQRFLNGETA